MKKFASLLKVVLGLVLLNLLGQFVPFRWDLTEDQRYTLSEAAIRTAQPFVTPVMVDVLLDGPLPAEFVKLKEETRQLLEEFATENNNIKFNFLDPLADAPDREALMAELQALGLTPAQITVEEEGKVSQELIFPWAMVNHGDRTVRVSLLKNKLGASTEERVNNSVENLEYAFADAFSKLATTKKKKVAVLKGNGELEDIYMADYLGSLREYYNLGAITLDSVPHNPQGVLDQLKQFDLTIIAKPTQAFSDAEKYVMDQYMVQGGKTLWLVDPVVMELDSLFNEKGTALAHPRDLNLTDFFFKYGVRLNPDLVEDLYFTQIVLATGEGNNSQYNPVPWYFHPMVLSKNNHPINNNLEAIRIQFGSSMDTLANAYRKTILLQSSPLSRTVGTPTLLNLEAATLPPNKEQFTQGNQFMGVLVEGEFTSAFANRVKPLRLEGSLEKGPDNKMLVVADGDLIKNQIRNGRPLELGYDKWTNNFYGNKEFLINAVNYLLDDDGLINIRNKEVAIPFLDAEKIQTQKSKWQLINIGLPLLATLLLGLFFNSWRKRKYGR